MDMEVMRPRQTNMEIQENLGSGTQDFVPPMNNSSQMGYGTRDYGAIPPPPYWMGGMYDPKMTTAQFYKDPPNVEPFRTDRPDTPAPYGIQTGRPFPQNYSVPPPEIKLMAFWQRQA